MPDRDIAVGRIRDKEAGNREGTPLVTLIDSIDTRPRHPEKANRPENEMLRKPDWIRVKAPGSPIYKETQQIVRENNLVTVCEEAGCPNIGECWSKKHATMMIMGEICTAPALLQCAHRPADGARRDGRRTRQRRGGSGSRMW